MKNVGKMLVAVAIAFVAGFQGLADGGTRAPKALVVMLDGTRTDMVDNGFAPNIRRFADGKWQPGYRGICRHSFVGDVDEFAIWTRTLTHEEVRSVYKAGLAGKFIWCHH